MSLFASIQNANIQTKEEDVLGGSRTVPSNVYPAAIKLAYLDSSKNSKAICAVFDFALLVNGKERNHKETIYISDGKGCFTYKDKQSGEDKPMPGFVTVDSICKAVTGKSITQLSTEKKTIKVYDFDQKAEVPQEKEVLMDLLRGKLELGILEVTVDKTAKNESYDPSQPKQGTNLPYLPTGETRDQNELSKAFNEDGLTQLEKESGATEAKFKAAWVEQYAGKKINKSKGAATGAKAGGVSKPAAASPLFG